MIDQSDGLRNLASDFQSAAKLPVHERNLLFGALRVKDYVWQRGLKKWRSGSEK
jgi:hypothetical protein